MKNLLRKILIGTLLLGTSFVPVSAANIATEYNVEIKASATDESLANEYFELEKKLCDAKKYNEAVVAYSKAIQLDPKYINAYNNRGYVYHNLGKYDLALNDWQKALELYSNDQNVKNNLKIIQNLMRQ